MTQTPPIKTPCSYALDESIFRTYDIRGQTPEELPTELFWDLGHTFGKHVLKANKKSVCVGHDTRANAIALAKALIVGLEAAHVDVTYLGMVPTPVVYSTERLMNLDAGLMITGSHMQPQANGLKISLEGKPFYGADLQHLKKLLSQEQKHLADTLLPPQHTVLESYTKNLCASFAWPNKPCTIVWDFGGGATAVLQPWIARFLPGNHHFLHTTPSAKPPRPFDPTAPGALGTLKNSITQHEASIGFAFDGDGDRLVVVDATGQTWSGDETLTFFAYKQTGPECIVADIKSSPLLMDTLEAPVLFSKTGHVHLKQLMRDENASIGGEVSGHFFFRDRHPGFDDGFYAALRFLELMHIHTLDPVAWRRHLPKRFSSDEKRIPLAPSVQKSVLERLIQNLPSNASIDTQDGIRVICEDGWWIARMSQTESVLVLRWESRTRENYEKIKKNFRQNILSEEKNVFFL